MRSASRSTPRDAFIPAITAATPAGSITCKAAYYQKGFNKHGPLSNPFAFGYFPAMKHDRVPRFTHSFVIYEADAFPQPYRGVLFGVAPLLNHVVMSRVSPDGSSFQTRDIGLAVSSTDPWFRPVDIKLGPDGSLFIADWYDRQVNHYRNHEGQLDAANGRIYRLKARDSAANPSKKPVDLAKRTTSELVTLLRETNKWTRQTAQRLLADRRDPAVAPELLRLLAENTGQICLEALWALNAVGKLDEPAALKALEHPDAYVRLWAVRLSCDECQVTSSVSRALARRAAIEPSVEVRSQLACSAKRLPAADALPILRALLAHNEDQRDIHIPLLIWWAVESKVATDPELVLTAFSERETWNLPIVKSAILERLMRRFAAAGTRQDLGYCARLITLAPGPGHVKRLMAGFESAFAGRPLAGLPPDLVHALAAFSRESITFGLRSGKSQAISEALAMLADTRADRTKLLQILQTLGEVRLPSAVPAMLHLACESSDNALRSAALNALTGYADPAIASAVIKACPTMTDDVLFAAQSLLVTRRTWANEFLSAVQADSIDSHRVPREIVEKLLLLGDPALANSATRLWGPLKPASTAELQARIDRFAAVVRAGSGIPKPGKKVFDQQCTRCHTLFGKGGKVGPDLTTYRRDDLESMLLNIVNPGAEIREGFAGSIVAATDGRILSGVILEQDKNVVILRDIEGHDVTLDRTAIETMHLTQKSLMPEGLLDSLTAQQVRDLFAYLRSTQPLVD